MRSSRLGFWIGLSLFTHGAGAQSPPPASDAAIVEWPVGQTTCANCGLLCRKHHNFKTSKAWRLTRNDDDSVDWHSPHGFDWHVESATYEEFLDAGPPAAEVA